MGTEQLLLFLFYAGFFCSGVNNKLEKIIVQHIWGSNDYTNRPVYEEGLDMGAVLDIPDYYGMPSGHVETAALVCTMLYYNGVIDIILACLITTFVGLQRITVDRHTVLQVLVGGALGVVYGGVYLFVEKMAGQLVWMMPPVISLMLYTISRNAILA